ncbi:ParA family protein [Pantanalinema rosaneae CENA516]|uniref:ParA family protein n=1 Tax=Pantanalinema rosaneae TaxID=1620701 RepID=UPI003D6EDD1D
MSPLANPKVRPAQVATKLKQIVLWIGANSGGVSKTTLAIHIAYEMARRGLDVAILDLDTNVSMAQFSGLSKNPAWEETISYVLSDDFAGDWPLATPSWGKPKGKVEICRGGPVMVQTGLELALKKRREYILQDRLSDFPLPHQLIILDCPATLGSLNDIALAVSTHLLIPVELTPKSLSGCDALLAWYRISCKEMRLNPPPQILGVVPARYNQEESIQRDYLKLLPQMLAGQNIPCYPSIRYSREFINASDRGIPLPLHRKAHKACQDFLPICNDLTASLRDN